MPASTSNFSAVAHGIAARRILFCEVLSALALLPLHDRPKAFRSLYFALKELHPDTCNGYVWHRMLVGMLRTWTRPAAGVGYLSRLAALPSESGAQLPSVRLLASLLTSP